MQNRLLVCFAVKEEAAPFRQRLGQQSGVQILLTGMGGSNAERAVRNALASPAQAQPAKPDLVLSCGFAGGLRPDLERGAVLYETDTGANVSTNLEAAGARKARFLFSTRVATTAAEKRVLYEQSKADAVEMESQTVRAICTEHGIPSATVRVVLDTADEDLPFDFNDLMTPYQRLSYGKLALALARSPGKISVLLHLQKQSQFAAEKLATVLLSFLKSAKKSQF